MRINVRAKPGSKKPGIAEAAGLFSPTGEANLIVAVAEPAVDGRANRAIEKALAAYFNVAPSRVQVVAGHTARNKIVEIR